MPIDLAGVDDVTDAVLVLDDHEDAGEEVLDEALGPEAEGDAADARRGEHRSERDAEERHDRERGDAADDEGRDALAAARPSSGCAGRAGLRDADRLQGSPAPRDRARRSACREVAVATTRSMRRCSSKRATKPTTRVTMMSSGVPTSQAPTSSQVRVDRPATSSRRSARGPPPGCRRRLGRTRGDEAGQGGQSGRGSREVKDHSVSVGGVGWSGRGARGPRRVDVPRRYAVGPGRVSSPAQRVGSALAVACLGPQGAGDGVAVLGDRAHQAGCRVGVLREPRVGGRLELLAREGERVEAADDPLADRDAARGPGVDEHRVVLLDVGLEQRQVRCCGGSRRSTASTIWLGRTFCSTALAQASALASAVGRAASASACRSLPVDVGSRSSSACISASSATPSAASALTNVQRSSVSTVRPSKRRLAREQRAQARLVGRVARRVGPGLDELELRVAAGLRRVSASARERRAEQGGRLGAVLGGGVEAGRRHDLADEDAQQGRVASRPAATRARSARSRVPTSRRRGSCPTSRRARASEAASPRSRAAATRAVRERPLVEADLRVGEVVVVEQQQVGLGLADERRRGRCARRRCRPRRSRRARARRPTHPAGRHTARCRGGAGAASGGLGGAVCSTAKEG